MAGPVSKKRGRPEPGSSKFRPQQRPYKKQKKQTKYHSDSDEDENPDFKPVNLLDSDDEDLNNIAVDDVASGSDSGSNSDSGSEVDEKTAKAALRNKKRKAQNPPAKDAPSSGSDDDESPSEDDEDDDSDNSLSDADDATAPAHRKPGGGKSAAASKRNDPSAFATSISKILSTKLATGRRADPVLSRSADAHQAARDVVDAALEAKARKQMREQRRLASEKGRVRDVLGGLAVGEEERGDGGGEDTGNSVSATQQRERRLRKVAHKGVVVLFRAVREAQERAARAEQEARAGGVYGVKSREEKVSEMSRQGFLDLIANGGGKLKKGALEEA